MIFFEWKDEYELGLPHIDLQHTMIVNMINELYASLYTGEELSTTDKVLAKLLEYVEDHFAAEELAMRESNYPDQKSHFAKHEGFRKTVNRLHGRHQTGERVAVHELTSFLKDWVKEHIAQDDKAFGIFVFQLSEEARKVFSRQNPTHPLAKQNQSK